MQAKLVASATSNLCEAANGVVQGQSKEEKLVVAAKAVASSTAQLLIACQVKADARSENNRRLQVHTHNTILYSTSMSGKSNTRLMTPFHNKNFL